MDSDLANEKAKIPIFILLQKTQHIEMFAVSQCTVFLEKGIHSLTIRQLLKNYVKM